MGKNDRAKRHAAAKVAAATKKKEEATTPTVAAGGNDADADEDEDEGADGAVVVPRTATPPPKGAEAFISSVAGGGEVKDSLASKFRTTTGVLASRPASRDIKIDSFSLTYHGRELISDTTVELNYGQRYGLIGPNGCGKSTMLRALAAREVPIPRHHDIFCLSEEAAPSPLTAIEAVVEEVRREFARLEHEADELVTECPDSELLQEIYDRMEEMDPNTFESRACELLHGLGFTHAMMNKSTKDMSGGWRMRVALARALFVQPHLLLLDEPTNHLDLGACVWLEDYLKNYPRILLLVSHSQDFLNGVCSHIINVHFGKLVTYGGNYDTYVRTRSEAEVNQMKGYKKQQEEIKHIKEFIASCGTFSNLVRQAKSRQKILDKMVADGLIEPVKVEPKFQFYFAPVGRLAPPVVAFEDVSFSYSGQKKDYLYSKVSFAVDLECRIALVGPNGAGKSTLLKLIVGDIEPCEGIIKKNGHLRIGRYNQHSHEILDEEMTVIDFIEKTFPGMRTDLEGWRSLIGRYGISGQQQMTKIGMLSDGQKTRVVFMVLSIRNPSLLLLDEPTNHLDLPSIDSLAEAINAFDGGLVLVSHDFRLINQVAKEIWICEHKKITPYKKDIQAYKNELRAAMARELKELPTQGKK